MAIFKPESSGSFTDYTGICSFGLVDFTDKSDMFDWADIFIEAKVKQKDSDYDRVLQIKGQLDKEGGKIVGGSVLKRMYHFFEQIGCDAGITADGKWEDSQGNEIHFEAQLMGDPSKQYVFGVDPASEVDNFSIVIIEMNPDHRRIVHCWTTNRSEHKEKIKKGYSSETDYYAYCARKIRDLMRRFNCAHIAMDAQGGGIAVMESLHDLDKIKEDEVQIWPVIDHDKPKDTDDERGLHILEMCQFAKYDWLAGANHSLRKDFEDKALIFPFFDSVSLGISAAEDGLKNRFFDTLEQCVMDIEELKDELAMIQMTQTASGRDRWDTPEVVVGAGKKSKMRKDRYSSLIMANMAARNIMKAPTPQEYNFYGGFATMDNPERKQDDNMYSGPNWFTDNMKDIY